MGAGNEPTIFHLTNSVRRVFATDLYLADGLGRSANATMLTEPERHWPADTPWNPRRLVVQHMDALDLRYEDESFDGVFSSSSIEHFGTSSDVHRALAEIHRVLKPGGVLSISTEHRLSGPPPGLPGILMFDAQDVSTVFVEPFDWQPLGPVELAVSEATLRPSSGSSISRLRSARTSRPVASSSSTTSTGPAIPTSCCATRTTPGRACTWR